jgi:hypothetical protein
MTQLQAAQVFAGVVAAATPWCVVRIALAVAVYHAQSVRCPIERPHAVAAVGRSTVLVVPAVAALASWLPPQSLWMAALDVAAFGGLSMVGLCALRAIHEASRPAREASSPVRVAALRPRHIGQYVAPAWRIALSILMVAALAELAWRLMVPVPHRRLLLPAAFALFAPVFLWLYEMWLRQVTLGGETSDAGDAGHRRGRRARLVFIVEVVLVCGYLLLAHVLLNLDWQVHAVRGAVCALAGACLGIGGCALALSSNLALREYRRV